MGAVRSSETHLFVRALEPLRQPLRPEQRLLLREHGPGVGGGRGLEDGLGEERPGGGGQQVEGHGRGPGGLCGERERENTYYRNSF